MRTDHILVTTATGMEAAPLVDRLSGVKTNGPVMDGMLGPTLAKVLVTGPGPVNTAMRLAVELEKNRPLLVIQAGCGGGFAQAGINRGDVVVATEMIDVQLGIEPDNPADMIAALPFPVLETPAGKIYGRYPADILLADTACRAIRKAPLATGCGVAMGPVGSVSTITATDGRAQALFDRFGLCMEAMEGAAAAHVCLHCGIPFLEVRGASNIAGHRDRTEWDIPLAATNAAIAVCAFVTAWRKRAGDAR
ncbi:MAG: futalosine hydrolase [Thermodesulfobacteriota bacterium]